MSSQTLVLENFPSPTMARALSPNGRVHWAIRRREIQNVKMFVAVKALIQGLGHMDSPIEIQPTFVYPVARKRDDDNLATGVMKAVRDGLVDAGYLKADDIGHLRQLPAIVEVQKKRRALILEFHELGESETAYTEGLNGAQGPALRKQPGPRRQGGNLDTRQR